MIIIYRLITTTIWMLTTTTIYQQDNMIQIFFHLHLADDNDNDSGVGAMMIYTCIIQIILMMMMICLKIWKSKNFLFLYIWIQKSDVFFSSTFIHSFIHFLTDLSKTTNLFKFASGLWLLLSLLFDQQFSYLNLIEKKHWFKYKVKMIWNDLNGKKSFKQTWPIFTKCKNICWIFQHQKKTRRGFKWWWWSSFDNDVAINTKQWNLIYSEKNDDVYEETICYC